MSIPKANTRAAAAEKRRGQRHSLCPKGPSGGSARCSSWNSPLCQEVPQDTKALGISERPAQTSLGVSSGLMQPQLRCEAHLQTPHRATW